MIDLKKRTLSAIIFGPVVVACFYFFPPNLFFFFIAIVGLFAVHELIRMSRTKNSYLVYFFSFASFLSLHFLSYSGYIFSLIFLLGTLILISTLKMREVISAHELFNLLQTYLFSSLFIFFPLHELYSLKAKKTEYAICLLFSVWASDILAYFFGGILGKHKLSPNISPGKTLEGLVGALLGPMIILVLFMNVLDFSHLEALLYGLLLGFSAQAGDLLESAIKRVHNVKDSSHVIPGHGGILDRIDSFILTSPLFNYLTNLR